MKTPCPSCGHLRNSDYFKEGVCYACWRVGKEGRGKKVIEFPRKRKL